MSESQGQRMLVHATSHEAIPGRRLARVTRVRGVWGYWIKGKRIESTEWDREGAVSAARTDLDNYTPSVT